MIIAGERSSSVRRLNILSGSSLPQNHPNGNIHKSTKPMFPHRCCPGRRDDSLRLAGGFAAEDRNTAGSLGVLVDRGSLPVGDTLGSTCFFGSKTHGFELASISPLLATPAVGAY